MIKSSILFGSTHKQRGGKGALISVELRPKLVELPDDLVCIK